MATFSHPSGNGYTESVELFPCIVWTALFGPLYLAYKQAWVSALILLILNPLAAFVAVAIGTATNAPLGVAVWLVEMVIIGWGAVDSIGQSYLKRGWKRV